MTALAPKLKQAAIIEFNQEKLEKHITAVEKKYKGIVVTEDNLSDIGKDRAAIAKLKQEITKAYRDVKSEANKPFSGLDDSVKKAADRLEKVYRSIKNQEDEFERQRRENVRAELEEIRQQIIADNYVNDDYAHLVEIKDSYLNKTADRAKVLDELTAQAKQAYTLQKADQDAAKVKEEKQKMIAEYCGMFNEKYELKKKIQSIRFNDLIDEDLDNIRDQIEQCAIRQHAYEKPAEPVETEAPATVAETPQEPEPEPQKAPVEPIQQDEEPGTLDIRIHATTQQRIALTQFMREAGIKFELIKSKAA